MPPDPDYDHPNFGPGEPLSREVMRRMWDRALKVDAQANSTIDGYGASVSVVPSAQVPFFRAKITGHSGSSSIWYSFEEVYWDGSAWQVLPAGAATISGYNAMEASGNISVATNSIVLIRLSSDGQSYEFDAPVSGSSPNLTVTDSVHTVTATDSITFAGATVSGSTGAATVTITPFDLVITNGGATTVSNVTEILLPSESMSGSGTTVTLNGVTITDGTHSGTGWGLTFTSGLSVIGTPPTVSWDGFTVTTNDPGTGDTTASYSGLTGFGVDLASGLAFSVGHTLSAQPASAMHSGVVDLTGAQILGNGDKVVSGALWAIGQAGNDFGVMTGTSFGFAPGLTTVSPTTSTAQSLVCYSAGNNSWITSGSWPTIWLGAMTSGQYGAGSGAPVYFGGSGFPGLAFVTSTGVIPTGATAFVCGNYGETAQPAYWIWSAADVAYKKGFTGTSGGGDTVKGGIVTAGGSGVTIANGSGIGVSGGPAYTITNTGVLSVNSATGAVTIAAGTGVGVSTVGSTITISATAVSDMMSSLLTTPVSISSSGSTATVSAWNIVTANTSSFSLNTPATPSSKQVFGVVNLAGSSYPCAVNLPSSGNINIQPNGWGIFYYDGSHWQGLAGGMLSGSDMLSTLTQSINALSNPSGTTLQRGQWTFASCSTGTGSVALPTAGNAGSICAVLNKAASSFACTVSNVHEGAVTLQPGWSAVYEDDGTSWRQILGLGGSSGGGGSGAPPSPPSGLTASPGNGSVSLSWTAGALDATFNVYYSTNSSMTGATFFQNTAGTSATVTGLTNGTTYYFGVTGVSGGGAESGFSNIVSATPAVRYSVDMSAQGQSGTTIYASRSSTGAPTGSSARSVSMWIKLAGVQTSSSAGNFIFQYGSTSTNALWSLAQFNSTWDFANSNTNTTGGSPASGTWYHVCVTYDGTTTKIYINGSVVATGTPTVSTASGTTMYIGGLLAGNFSLYGKVTDVRFYSIALTSGNVTTLYNSGKPQWGTDSIGSLWGWWQCQDASGATLADNSGNSRPMTLTGSYSWSTDTP